MPDPFAAIDAAGSPPSLLTGGKVGEASDPFAFIDSGGAPGDRLAATTRIGLVQDPARAARVLKMRDRIGMPADFIDRNLDQVEQETQRQGFDPTAFRRESPMVASWLEQAPEYAAVSRDDLGRLAAVEKFVADSPDYKFLPNGRIVGPPRAGLADEYATPLDLLRKMQQDQNNAAVDAVDAQMNAERRKDTGAFQAGFLTSGLATMRLVRSLTGQDSDEAKRVSDQIAQASATNDPGFWNDVLRGTGGLAADAPLMLAGGALAPLGRLRALMGSGKLAGMAATALAVQPLALREGYLSGMDNGWANGLASWGIETVVPAAFGPTGVEHIIESLAAKGIAKEAAPGLVAASLGLLKHAGLEGTEESVTELAHALHEAGSGINPDALKAEQLWPRLGVAGVVGAGAGGGFNLPGGIVQALSKGDPAGNVRRIEAALQAQALVQQLTAAAGESTTAQAYEAGAKTLFQTITAGKAEQVYIDREGWDAVAGKAGLDPRAAAIELMGGPPLQVGEPVDPKRARSLEQAAQAYDEAARTGAPLAIKTADLAFYLARKKEIADAVAKEVRLDPQALNVREVEAQMQAQETVTAAPDEQAQNTASEEAATIQTEIEQDLAAQGYSADAARRSAVQMASVFRTQAARFNEGKAPDDPTRLTPAKLWQEWGVSINRPVADVLARPTFQTAEQTITAMRSRLKAQTYAKADAVLAEADSARMAAQGQADQQLAQDAAGEPGERILAEATTTLEQARTPGGLTFGDAMRVLGTAFGFKPDATAAKLTPEQTRRGNLLALALRTRGGSLASLIEDAGASRPDPTATTAKAQTAAKDDPRLEKLAADGLRLRDLVAAIQAGRADIAELEQAAALAAEVGPELGRLPLDQQRIEDIRAAVEFAQDGQTLNQPAYHGTGNTKPYESGAISYDKVNAPGGEGTQNEGHGVYVTGSEGAGRFYQKQNSGHAVTTYKGKGTLHWMDARIKSPTQEISAAISVLDSIDILGTSDFNSAKNDAARINPGLADAINSLREDDFSIPGKGRLYTVEIPDDNGQNYLDWDSPISEQPRVKAAVIAAIVKAGAFPDEAARIVDAHQSRYGERFTGEKAYALVQRQFGINKPMDVSGSERAQDTARSASDALRSAGIIGNKYLGSEGQGPYHNYVIFDNVPYKSYEQRKDAKRGSITFVGKPGERRTLIRLFESADLSTFLHESGHLYLEVLSDLAARPGAPAQIKADLAQALAYIGATDYAGITTEQHETWARTWEGYLMEGKAPTAELRGVFARFAAWMASLYRSVKGLAVNLTPEVRGVMDRLIATNEEIDAAAKSMGSDGFAEHAAEMGLSAEQVAGIVKADADALAQAQTDLQSQAMREIRREHEAHWKELRAEVGAEVEAEVNAEPVYIAESVLRRGTMPGGAPLREGMPAIKLDSAEVNRRIDQLFHTAEERAANRKRLAMMHARTDGIPLDQAAELVGFPSGDALLQGLLTMRPRKELIEAETDARMRSRFGDILTDGAIAEKAMESLHGERRGDVHMAKVQALARKVGKKAAPVEVMRAAAEAKIANTAAGDVLPHLYLRAEVKAREQVQKHLAKQEWDGALAAKQREMLNHELYRAAIQARKDIDSVLEYSKKLDEQKARERIGKAGGWEWTVTAKDGARFTFPTEEAARQAAAKLGTTTWERTSGYLEQIDALRERFSLKRATAKDAERRQSLNAWVNQQRAAGVPVNLPAELLNEARKTPWRKASVAELIGLRDGLAQIKHLADTKNKLSKAQKLRELQTLATTMAATLERTKPNPKPVDAEDGRRNKVLDKAADFWAAHRKVASLLREMDGWEDGGPFTDALMRTMNEAADNESSLLWEAKQKQDALWNRWHDAIGKEDWQPNERKTFAGFRGGLTRMGGIMVALNWGNEGNRTRLLEGNKLTEAQVLKVLDALTPADWNLVEGIWEHIDSYWSEIQALEQRVTGTAPEKVAPSPFPTKHGTIKGGYFPIVNNREAAALRIDGDAADWAKQMAAQAYGRAVTKHGHTEARTIGQGFPLSLDPNVIGRHLSQVAHDLTHREALGDAARILANDAVAEAIAKHMGPRTLAQMKTWLGDIATNGRPATGAAKMMSWLRRGFSMAAMGFRPMTAALQLTGFVNGAQRVGVGRMAYAMRQLFATPEGFSSNFALAMAKSKMMANRMRTQTQDLTEVMSGIKRDRFSQAQEATTRYGFWMIQKMQTVVDTATWLAGYAQAIEGGASEADAIAQADQVVIDTQSGGQIKDLSGVQRDAFGQAFTGAFTYGAMLFNQLHDVAGGTAARYRSGDKSGAYINAFTGFMLTAVIPAAMTMAMRGLLRGTPEHEKDPYIKRYGIELLSTIMGTMIGVRELSGAIQGFSYQGPATTKTLGAYTDLIGQIGQGELDKNLLRAINDAVGGTLALPSGQIWATGTGVLDWLEHPSVDLRPIVFGPPPKR